MVPYGPLWHDKIAANFAIHGDAFDFAMWDSQSTAEFAGGGHAYSINKVFQDSPYLKAELFSPLSLKLYGEYPDDSGKFWGLPVNQDAYGMMYRKDSVRRSKGKGGVQGEIWTRAGSSSDLRGRKTSRGIFHQTGPGALWMGPDGRTSV